MKRLICLLLPLGILIAGCSSRGAPVLPDATAVRSVPLEGLASYYAHQFHGRTTASGTRFDMNALVAAHPSFPFGTVLRVTNLANGRSVRVRIEDRGPALEPRREGVIIDLSYGAARALRFLDSGRTKVRLQVMRWGTRG
jgi:rare lipoprotein A